MTRLVIDPVTRVGGQLRVEVELEDGVVSDAWVAGTMYRGLERILEGRDARDAWLMAQRICGTCGPAHAITSVRALENALGVTPTPNARVVRNLLAGLQLVVDEVSSFYLRQAFDWIDVTAALRADPDATSALARSLSDWPNSSAATFTSVRDRLAGVTSSDQPGLFTTAGPTHPGYRLGPEASLLVVAHYFEALDWRRKVLQVHTILGGKSPHIQTLVVGGMAIAPDWGGPARPVPGEHLWDVVRNAFSPLGEAGLGTIAQLLDEAKSFVEQVFLPDVLTTMASYREWGSIGQGIGHYLSFGELPGDGSDRPELALPRGRVMDRDIGRLIEVGAGGVAETTAHSWYVPSDDPGALVKPFDATTEPRYAGPRPPYASLAGSDRYSWLKAPRYEDDPMEVGPLARLLVGSAARNIAVQDALRKGITTLGVGGDALYSTLGRIVARAIEAGFVADRLTGWLTDLRDNLASGDLAMTDLTVWDPAGWPADVHGFALGESARGAISHWITVHDGRIAAYEIVDASTWNASPRDGLGRRGALEEALIGTRVIDAGRPLEVIRTIHSFDPCLSCGVH
ncbi:MAG TPA: nickel-dependent hydrogenase large subunit [Candidatus Acidoferrales bacterium]|nr:nickel-dependent hydrogenase large subunit [Candidatus Acidoferrales bacterium]